MKNYFTKHCQHVTNCLLYQKSIIFFQQDLLFFQLTKILVVTNDEVRGADKNILCHMCQYLQIFKIKICQKSQNTNTGIKNHRILQVQLFDCYSLLASFCQPLVTFSLLLVTFCSLFVSFARCLLLFSRCCLLLFARCLLRFARC